MASLSNSRRVGPPSRVGFGAFSREHISASLSGKMRKVDFLDSPRSSMGRKIFKTDLNPHPLLPGVLEGVLQYIAAI
jgi:hypothetical protein